MLKNILNLEGAQKLTATEQKEIIGGIRDVVCGEGGWRASVDSCVCTSGLYDKKTDTCFNGPSAYSGNYYEWATGCCYGNL